MREVIGKSEYYAVVGLIHLIRDQAKQVQQTEDALRRLLEDDDQFSYTSDLAWNTDKPDDFLKEMGIEVQGP